MQQAQTLEAEADRAAAAGDFRNARMLLERAAAAAGGAGSVGLWTKIASMCKASGDLHGALAAIDRALGISPLDFPALLTRAVILEALGDPSAGAEYGNALAQINPTEPVPPMWQAAVAHARSRRDEYQLQLEQRLAQELPQGLSAVERKRAERLISNFSRRTRYFHQEPSDFHYPGMPEIEFHDAEQFPGLEEFEAQTAVIRAEFDALIAAEAAEMVPYVEYPDQVPMRQWKELNKSRKWTAIHLLRNGQRIEANARHCPKTMAAIAKLPQPRVKGASPNAMFSLLAPRTRIPPHTGVANTRLVCHLPLIVPPKCGFRCGETIVEWRVGETFVFDDTIEHEAWNDSDELRVVLIVDLWAPTLSAGDRAAVAAVIGASGTGFGGA